MSEEYTITVSEASQILEVSKRTVRRRIKNGKLKAIKKKSAYGEQWFLKDSQFNNTAQAIKDVVDITEVNKPIPLDKLRQAFQQALDNQTQEIIKQNKQLIEDNQKLKKQNEELKENLTQLKKENKAIAGQLQKIMGHLEKNKENKGIINKIKNLFN